MNNINNDNYIRLNNDLKEINDDDFQILTINNDLKEYNDIKEYKEINNDNSQTLTINNDLKKYKEINIINYLKIYKNKKIIYIPNPGNAGDSLIAFGTFKIFKKIGLKYEIGNINNKYNNQILFFAGGGNLVGIYKNCKNFIINNKNKNKIIILPHTINKEDDLIKNLNNNVILICREKISYNYVHKIIKNKNNVMLSKDMAFYINNIEKYKKIKGKGICNCFRKDCEKTSINIPNNNIDLSNKLNKPGNTSNINIINSISLSIFDYLSKYDTINTNRLHMAIAGSLLNKKVNFYSNNYYKNKAVFDYSINNIFKKTVFHK
jgi:exopolysaccharide biosynthesis predicted pyruvyltransferase EpsI